MLLSDLLDNTSARDTVLELVQSGLMVYNVMERRLLLVTVLIMAGVHTTTVVATTDPGWMCQSDASVRQLPILLWRLRYLAPAKVLHRKYMCIPTNSLDFNKLIAFIIDKDSEIYVAWLHPTTERKTTWQSIKYQFVIIYDV